MPLCCWQRKSQLLYGGVLEEYERDCLVLRERDRCAKFTGNFMQFIENDWRECSWCASWIGWWGDVSCNKEDEWSVAVASNNISMNLRVNWRGFQLVQCFETKYWKCSGCWYTILSYDEFTWRMKIYGDSCRFLFISNFEIRGIDLKSLNGNIWIQIGGIFWMRLRSWWVLRRCVLRRYQTEQQKKC